MKYALAAVLRSKMYPVAPGTSCQLSVTLVAVAAETVKLLGLAGAVPTDGGGVPPPSGAGVVGQATRAKASTGTLAYLSSDETFIRSS